MSPEGYLLHDGRMISEGYAQSVANALTVNMGATPTGKVRTILSAAYYPSVNETQTVFIATVGQSTFIFPKTIPLSIALGPAIPFPLLTEGNEVKLFPGQYLSAIRDAATAGSSMIILWSYIETDLPYFQYEEPLNKVVVAKKQHGRAFFSRGALSIGSKPSPSNPSADRGARGGSSEPI